MAVETKQSASAAVPSQGGSPVAASAAPSPLASDSALSFEAALAEELGEEAGTGNAELEQSQNGSTNPDENPDEDDAGDDAGAQDDADSDAGDGAADEGETDRHAGDADDPDTGANAGDGADDPAEDTAHEDLPPEHFKKLPAWAQKRLGKQAETVKALKTELANAGFAITPTPANPLSHVEDLTGLQKQIDLAKQVRAWVKANPEGGVIGETEISPEDAAAKLAHAEAVLEAAPDWKERLNARAAAKPWEGAREVCPEMFEPGTEAHAFAQQALKLCPEIKLKLANWEMLLAAAARSIVQVVEEKSGKAKYVRMEVKDGKVVAPVKPAGSPKPGTKPAPRAGTPRPPATPNGSPPPLRTSRGNGGKADLKALEARYEQTRDPEDLAALTAAEMAA